MSITKIRLAALRFLSSTVLPTTPIRSRWYPSPNRETRAVGVHFKGPVVGGSLPAGVEGVDEFLDPDGVLGRQHAALQVVARHGPGGVVDVHGEGRQRIVLAGDEGVDSRCARSTLARLLRRWGALVPPVTEPWPQVLSVGGGGMRRTVAALRSFLSGEGRTTF